VSSEHCPSLELLQRLQTGAPSPAEADGLRRHLERCERCRALASAPEGAAAAALPRDSTAPADPTAPVDLAAPTRELPLEEAALLSDATPAILPTGSLLPEGEAPAPLGRGSPVGRYILLDTLGEGGMGVVYAAYDPQLHRRVAIKVLQPGAATGSASINHPQARLLREAQALAKLAHPNVLAVHDVGTVGEQVFIALELVDGLNARQWMAQERPWREVVRVFGEAGRGLAAAHAAGLVHRDFKPDNVLVGATGRVYVMDFGVARSGGHAPTPAELDALAEASALDTPLTQAGLVLGTPSYLAPELFSGAPASTASDQFAFCVALYEALYGQKPFPRTLHFDSPERWTVLEPARPRRVPAWVRRVVLRGLRRAPEERYASMAELVSELDRDRQAGVLRLAGAVAAAGLLLAGVALTTSGPGTPAPCSGAARRLAGVWDAPAQASLEAGFAALQTPFAAETWTRTRDVLEAYTRGWVGMHTEACEATRVRGEQSDEVLSLRMRCLEQRLGDVKALTALLQTPDAALLRQAVKAAHGLPRLEGCANVEALLSPVRLPTDEAVRARVDAVRAGLSEGRALFQTGRYAQGVERVRPLAARARELGYRPLEAEALELLGTLEERSGDAAGSTRTLLEAVFAAEAGGHAEVAASASAALTRSLMVAARYGEARLWGEHARAALQHLGGEPRIEANLLMALGSVEVREDKYEAARPFFERALALRREALGPEHPDVAACYNNLGAVEGGLERPVEALGHFQRANALWRETLGEGHPDYAMSLGNLGRSLSALRRPREARASLLQGVEARGRLLGPEHPGVAEDLIALADAEGALEEWAAAAAAARRARAIYAKSVGKAHDSYGNAAQAEGDALAALGRCAEALPLYEEAQAAFDTSLGPSSFDALEALLDRADCHGELGQVRRAQALFQRARALDAKAPPNRTRVSMLRRMSDFYAGQGRHARAHALALQAQALAEPYRKEPWFDEPAFLATVARAQLGVKQAAQARASAERALELAGRAPEYGRAALAELRFVLAQTLMATGEAARARAMAEQARDVLRARQLADAAARVDRWLLQHPPRS
jgi:hypothetical protein